MPSASLTILNEPPHTATSIAELVRPNAGLVRGLYLHVPFCFHKCHYCDFYSIVDSRDRQDAFVDRLIGELRAAGPYLKHPIETIFVGGGTPTLLTTSQWDRLFGALREVAEFAPGCEFTVEANPETVTADLAACLACGGVNRISIGAQSFHPHLLESLERQHDPANVVRTVGLVCDAGIVDINIDLIFAIPGQSLAQWQSDLEHAVALEPTHVSCYGLMYEPNTPLIQRMKRGEVQRADEDLEAAMYECTLDTLESAGYAQYEISNWSLAGRQCAHNLLYWRNAAWWPLGPSASGHCNGVRWKNRPRLGDYLESSGLSPVQDVERLEKSRRTGEELMLRLRLREGVDASQFEPLAETDPHHAQRCEVMKQHMRDGLLEAVGGRLRLTRAGLLLADTVLSDLL